MDTVSSTHNQSVPLSRAEEARSVTNAPVVVSERGLFLLALVRIFYGYLWFQQIFWKMPPDFKGLHSYVVSEGQHTFVPGYSYIIQHVLLPNFLLLGAATWTAELVVGLLLMLGLFSRFAALIATIMAVQLYVGLAVAPGEWYWTYGMLVLIGIALLALPTGRRLGIDRWLVTRLQAKAHTNILARILYWFV